MVLMINSSSIIRKVPACPIAPSVRVMKCEVWPGAWLLAAFDGSYLACAVSLSGAASRASQDSIDLALFRSFERLSKFLRGESPLFPSGWVVAGLGEFLEGHRVDGHPQSTEVH